MRSQVAAASATTGSPTISPVSGRAPNCAATAIVTPAVSASHDPWTPSATAASRWPAPNRRAARAVVPYEKTVPSQAATVSTLPPIASAARGTRPRWPTTAVSTSTYSGSTASTTRAGSASAAMRRSVGAGGAVVVIGIDPGTGDVRYASPTSHYAVWCGKRRGRGHRDGARALAALVV